MANVNFSNAYKSTSLEDCILDQPQGRVFDKAVFEYSVIEFNHAGFIKRHKAVFSLTLNKETELWSVTFETDKLGYPVIHQFGEFSYLEARKVFNKNNIKHRPPIDTIYNSIGRGYLNGEIVIEQDLAARGRLAMNFEQGVFDTPEGPSAFYKLVPERHPFAEWKYKMILQTNGGVVQNDPKLPSGPRLLMNSLTFKSATGALIELDESETENGLVTPRNAFSDIVGGELSLNEMKGYFDGWFFEVIYHVKNAEKLASGLGVTSYLGEEITAVIGVQFEVDKPYFRSTLSTIDEELNKHFQLHGEAYIEFTIKGFAVADDGTLPQSNHRTIRFSKGAIKVENFGFSIR